MTIELEGRATLPKRETPSRNAVSAWGRLAQDRLALLGLIILTIVILLALAAPVVARRDPLEIDPVNKLQMPSREHLMGTDNLGRSIWARVIWGSRLTLGTASAAMLLILLVGVAVGTVAGFYGGWVDNILMRLVDILLAFPSLILALAIAGMLGPSLINVLIGIAAVGWATYARVVRGMILSVREKEYIEAAQALGIPPWRLALHHLLPNVISPVVVLASLDMGSLLLSISALSFLGLGAQAPEPEWGRMLNDARPFMQIAPHTMIFPGLAIFLCVMAFNLLGDGLRDALDPQGQRS
ncbi:MAG: ABC transporter permease subunit [Anaerolineae bacterium]|nr:ABC transporter permease subunit [Anaerolineae bacterium]